MQTERDGEMTVMIVDDDSSCRSLIGDLLEMEGYRTMACEGPLEALQVLKHAMAKPDLFIVDFGMNRMNGYELIRELRGRSDTHGTPILMLTATHKNIRELAQMEGVEFLAKSTSNRTILSVVRRLTGRPAAAAPPAQPPAALPSGNMVIVRSYFDSRPLAAQPRLPSAPQPPAARFVPPARFEPPVPPPAAREVPPAPREDRLEELERLVRRLESSAKEEAEAPPLPPRVKEDAPEARMSEGLKEDLDASNDSPAVRLVETMLNEAVQRQASDIHVEPQEDEVVIRVRIDGTLHPLLRAPLDFEPMVSARIKVMANLDITEKRVPQDGHFTRPDREGRKVEFRVSTLPSLYGEKIVLRVLQAGRIRVKLDTLGLSDRNGDVLQNAMKASAGLVLVTGPTGSGKTSTLYSMLDALNKPQRNIVTVEDPVEYRLKGVTQVEVRSQVGYTFERVLRHLLRQDPNIILVGEIRDAETAMIALKAAVTGHMVLSTLHTNDASSTLHRLVSMGVPPYLVAAACRLVIAQRLIRRLCPDCKRDRKSTRLNSSHNGQSRMPSSA